MHNDDDAKMSTDDRLEELAALLAAGFLHRKRRTGYCPAGAAQPGVFPRHPRPGRLESRP